MASTQTTPPQRCDTRYFGPVEYSEESVMVFPDGIPAFEQEKRFLALRQPINEPMVFLQSIANPSVCFATLPALAACPHYLLSMAPEDLDALGLETNRPPAAMCSAWRSSPLKRMRPLRPICWRPSW